MSNAPGGLLDTAATIGFALCCLSGFALGAVAFVNAIIMVRCRKEGVPLVRPWHGAGDIMFRPQDLTARGLRARRFVIVGFLGELACILLALAIHIGAGVGEFSTGRPLP